MTDRIRIEFGNHASLASRPDAPIDMRNDELIRWRRRLQLIFFGYSEAEILRFGDLAKFTDERINELIRSVSPAGLGVTAPGILVLAK